MIKVSKGSISRFIEEHRLAEYKEKGFEPVGESISEVVNKTSDGEENPDTKDEPINIEEMTVPQLKAFAETNGFDISGAKVKADIIEKIMAAKIDATADEELHEETTTDIASESEGEAHDITGTADEA